MVIFIATVILNMKVIVMKVKHYLKIQLKITFNFMSSKDNDEEREMH